jgi:hypothetical protein
VHPSGERRAAFLDRERIRYEEPGYHLARALAGLIESADDEERAAKLDEFVELLCPQGQTRVRSFAGFIASSGAERAIAWLKRELPRCMALVPARLRVTFLREMYRCVVEERYEFAI